MRRLIRVAQAANHLGVAVIYDAISGAKLEQVAFSKIAHLMGHRKEAYFHAVLDNAGVTLYDEVPREKVK